MMMIIRLGNSSSSSLLYTKINFKQKIVVDNEDKSKYPIKDTIKKSINKKVAEILASLIDEARGMHAYFSKLRRQAHLSYNLESVNVQTPVGQVQVITEDAPVKIVQGKLLFFSTFYMVYPNSLLGSPVSLASSAKTTSINTDTPKATSGPEVKTIKQSITFDVPPQPLYEFLTDERKISAFTQGPCKFSTISPGGAFEMFGGNVVGTQVLFLLSIEKKLN